MLSDVPRVGVMCFERGSRDRMQTMSLHPTETRQEALKRIGREPNRIVSLMYNQQVILITSDAKTKNL